MSLCRADKVLLSGCAAMLGSTALFGPTALSFGVPAGLLATVLADGIFRPSSNTLYPTISHGPRSSNRVALTFDDGPHPETTPRVLDVLAQYNARATFFMIGRILESGVAIAERAVREGSEIGNHSWNHGYFKHAAPVNEQLVDIERCESLIRSITGEIPRSPYRAPVGLKSPRFARAAHQLSLEDQGPLNADPALLPLVGLAGERRDPGGHRGPGRAAALQQGPEGEKVVAQRLDQGGPFRSQLEPGRGPVELRDP